MNGLNPSRTIMQLFDAESRRLYLTEEERRAFLRVAALAPREVRAFCDVLHVTGFRISEALALKRCCGVCRVVPVPPELLDPRLGARPVRSAAAWRG